MQLYKVDTLTKGEIKLMKTIQGSKEFLKEITKATTEIDNTINELTKEIDKLELDITSNENDFSLENIRNAKAKRKDVETNQEIITSLENRKRKLVQQSAQSVLERTEQLIDQDRETKRAKHLKERNKLYQLLTEAEQLNEKLEQKDLEYTKAEQEFVKEISVYLNGHPDLRKPIANKEQINQLRNKVRLSVYSLKTKVLEGKKDTLQDDLSYAIE